MITDKDVENKRNEVRMLQLQICEIDARRTINDLKRETAVQDGNTWTLCFDTNQNETTIDGVDVELKGAKVVIENQVKAIDELSAQLASSRRIVDQKCERIDYEIGTRKKRETLIDELNSQLVVSKCVVADQLKVIERKRDVIDGLMARLDSSRSIIDELKEKLSRAHGITCEQETVIGELHDHIDELDCSIAEQRKIAIGYKELNVWQHGKLEEIKSVISDRCVYTPNHAIINEIRAIIQEE